MRRALFGLAALLSLSAHAGELVSTFNFSFNLREHSFTTPVSGGERFEVSYILTPLELSFDYRDLRTAEGARCAEWTVPGTSPDDPGVCGREVADGWRLSFEGGERDVYAVRRVVRNRLTGERTVTELPRMKAYFTVDNVRRLRTANVPASVNLVGYVNSGSFGCAVRPAASTRMNNRRVDVAVCEHFRQRIDVTLDAEGAQVNNAPLAAEARIYVTWQDRDIHGRDLSRPLFNTEPLTQLSFGPLREN